MNRTDSDWENYGKNDPYFGVFTETRFRKENLDANALHAFFESGEAQIERVFSTMEREWGPLGDLQTGIDFGCGVGRVLLPLQKRIVNMIGVDVSASMLREAQRNIDSQGITRIRLVERIEDLADIVEVDFVHSFVVLQHIPEACGQEIISDLVGLLRKGGIGVLHVLYFNPYLAQTIPAAVRNWYSASNIYVRSIFGKLLQRGLKGPEKALPAMQMNPYDLNKIFLQLQRNNVQEIICELTDYGGFLGTLLYFRKS